MERVQPTTFESFLTGITVWDVLGAILLLGAASIAILQLINELTPVRTLFHRRWLRRWIEEQARTYEKSPGKSRDHSLPRVDAHEAFILLVSHSTGGDVWEFLGLPTDQFVAQINAAAQIALEYPQQNFSLLAVLSQTTTLSAMATRSILLRRSLWNPDTSAPTPKEEELNRTIQEDLDTVLHYVPTPPDQAGGSAKRGAAASRKKSAAASEPVSTPESQMYFDARNRLGHAVQRNLDGLQIGLSNSTSIWNQALAIGVSVALIPVTWLSASLPLPEMRTLLGASKTSGMVLLVGIAAGYVAPVLGDIVVAIRRLGRR